MAKGYTRYEGNVAGYDIDNDGTYAYNDITSEDKCLSKCNSTNGCGMYVFVPKLGKDDSGNTIKFGACNSDDGKPCCALKAAASDPVTLKDDINMVQRTLPWMKASVFGIKDNSNYTYNDASSLDDSTYPYKISEDNSIKYLVIGALILLVVIIVLIVVLRKKRHTTTSKTKDTEMKGGYF